MIYVSTTTTASRLPMLQFVLYSLSKQNVSEFKILVNISSDPYLEDEGINNLPSWINQFDIEINWVKNTGPYRKLVPTLDRCSIDDLVITVDDDVIYSEFFIESLIKRYKQHPNAIICTRGRQIQYLRNGNPVNYSNLKNIKSERINHDIIPIGCGGVLYAKNLLDLDFLFNNSCLEEAPRNDDLWFRVASLRKGSPVYVLPELDTLNLQMEHNYSMFRNFNSIKESSTLTGKAFSYVRDRVYKKLNISKTSNDFIWKNLNKKYISHYNPTS